MSMQLQAIHNILLLKTRPSPKKANYKYNHTPVAVEVAAVREVESGVVVIVATAGVVAVAAAAVAAVAAVVVAEAAAGGVYGYVVVAVVAGVDLGVVVPC